MRWAQFVLLPLALAAALTGCGATTSGDQYQINWTFVNTSCADVIFTGEDPNAGQNPYKTAKFTRAVAKGDSAFAFTDGERFGTNIVELVVTVSAGASSRVSVDINLFRTTALTAVWDGTNLSLSTMFVAPTPGGPAASATPFEPSAGPPAFSTSRALARTPSDPSAVSCPIPTWTRVGIAGDASGSWSDLAGSGSGTLTVSFPPEVKEGETYQLSATFSGTLTYNPGWEMTQRNIDVSVCDRSGLSNVCGLAATSTQQLARGAASGSITWTGPWTVTSSYPATFTLEAAGGFSIQGTSPLLVATYSKQP